MNKAILNQIEEEYTCGSCLYLACALSRRYKIEMIAFIVAEEENGELIDIDKYDNFKDIPIEIREKILIDHMYAKKGNAFYDVYGKTFKPYSIGYTLNKFFKINEEELIEITGIDNDKLNDNIDLAYSDIDRFLKSRFKDLENKTKNKLKR